MTPGHPTHSTHQKKSLTNNALVPSWQGLPAWTAVRVEARSTHVGPVETRRTEQTNLLVTQTPQTCLSELPNKYTNFQDVLSPAWGLRGLTINTSNFDTRILSDDGWWYSQRGERRKEMRGADNNMRNPILFSLKAECKLERTGCIKSPFLQNSDTELLCLLENFQICCATQTCCPPPTADQALVLIGGEPSVTFDLPDRCRSHHSWWSAWLAWQVSHNVLLNGGSTKPHLGTAGLSPHSHTHTPHKHTHINMRSLCGLLLPRLMQRTLWFLSSVNCCPPTQSSVFLSGTWLKSWIWNPAGESSTVKSMTVA